MKISTTLVELNCWKVKDRWHFDRSPRRAGSFLSALQFKVESDEMELEGWLPLKVNVSGRLIQAISDATIEWADEDRTVVKFQNVEYAYWHHVSGNGHTEEQISDIRKSLAA